MCHDPQTVARRHFVVTPYEPDGDRLLPQLPDTCPVEAQDGRACRLFQDHFRERKTGPAFALCVMRCRTHAIGFTLYPPGYTPWGRKPWVCEGVVAKVEDEVKDNAEWFGNTYFEAALDAAGIQVNPVVEIGSREAVWKAVEQGIGIGAVADFEFVPHPRLRTVRISDAEIVTNYHIAYLKERRDSPLIKTLVDIAKGVGSRLRK